MPYPDEYDSFRTLSNVPGLDYNADDTTTLFAEDMAAVHSSIQQTQQFIGLADSIKTSPLYLAIMNIIYPVGKIVHFAEGINLAEHFGFGTWLMHEEGKVTVALNGSDTDFTPYGKTGGEKTVTLTNAEMPIHNHGAVGGGNWKIQTIYDNPGTSGKLNIADSGSGVYMNGSLGGYGDLGTDTATANKGGGQAHNNLAPYVVIARYVRTA